MSFNKFKRKKTYGEYQTKNCAFCGRQATQKTEVGLEVCYQHLKSKMEEIKCTCGSWLEQRSGKFGAYFNCLSCGNLNFQKGMEIKAITMKDLPKKEIEPTSKPIQKMEDRIKERRMTEYKTEGYQKSSPIKKERKEITISSNDVEYFD